MRLHEGRKEFLAWADGDKELLDRFLVDRSKFQAPENNMDWWIKNKTPQELDDFMKNYKSKTAKEKEEKIAGTDIVYDDENWKVIHLKTYDAAKHYGGDSTWCITGRYPGHEERGQYYFNQYLENQYTGYYLYVNKNFTDPRSDAKYMVCPKQGKSNECDIYDQEHNPSTIPFIPNCSIHVDGLPDVGQFTIEDGVLLSVKGNRSSSNVNVPNEVTTIGPRSFRGSKVEQVHLPNSVTTIAKGAFANSDLQGIIVPDSVTEIGASAFLNCQSLGYTKVILGKNITTLPARLFAYCDYLVRIRINGKITEIADNWLEGCDLAKIEVYCDAGNTNLIAWCKANKVDAIDESTAEVLSGSKEPDKENV